MNRLAFIATALAMGSLGWNGFDVESGTKPHTPPMRRSFPRATVPVATCPAFSRKGKQLGRGARKYGRAR